MKLNQFDDFIKVDDEYYGGSEWWLDSSLGFKPEFSSGSIALTNCLIYELNKHDELGTLGRNELEMEEYLNFVRNFVQSSAYRSTGFTSVKNMDRYIKTFGRNRRLNVETWLYYPDFFFGELLDFINSALSGDHPILMYSQYIGVEELNYRWVVITGLNGSEAYISSAGMKTSIDLRQWYDGDSKFKGLIYFDLAARR